MEDLFREHNVETDNQIAAGLLILQHLLRGRISDASNPARHAFTWHAKLSLRGDDLGRCDEHLPVIERVNSYRLHLQRFNKSQSVRIHQVVTFPLIVSHRLLSKLYDQVAGVSSK